MKGASYKCLKACLNKYKTYKTDVRITKRESVARSLSKRLSINYGKALSNDEMRNLVDELFGMDYALSNLRWKGHRKDD